MEHITEYIQNNSEEQVNEGLGLLLACLFGATCAVHLGFKAFHSADQKFTSFWNWVFDGQNFSR